MLYTTDTVKQMKCKRAPSHFLLDLAHLPELETQNSKTAPHQNPTIYFSPWIFQLRHILFSGHDGWKLSTDGPHLGMDA